MPENQSQPNTAGNPAPAGEPRVIPQPDAPPPDRPSDTEAAHAPEEGNAVRDPAQQGQGRADENRGRLPGGKDLTGDALEGRGVGETGERRGPA